MKKPKIIGDPKTGILTSIQYCDYCGGEKWYTEKEKVFLPQIVEYPQHFTQWHLVYDNQIDHRKIERRICMKCTIKALDKILGKPE